MPGFAALIVVGLVTHNSTRIVWDSTIPTGAPSHVHEAWACQLQAGDTVVDAARIPPPGVAGALYLQGLQPDTLYQLHCSHGASAAPVQATWRTGLAPGAQPGTLSETLGHRVVAVSCDRRLEDLDSGWWAQLAHEATPGTVWAHLGDQVYTDQLLTAALGGKLGDTLPELVAAWRGAYREAWTTPEAARVMATGMHLAVPDDHEVVNNLDAWMQDMPARAGKIPGLALKHRADGSLSLQYLLAAARVALFEYQVQLVTDLPGRPAAVWRPHRRASTSSEHAVRLQLLTEELQGALQTDESTLQAMLDQLPADTSIATAASGTAILLLDTRADRAWANRPMTPLHPGLHSELTLADGTPDAVALNESLRAARGRSGKLADAIMTEEQFVRAAQQIMAWDADAGIQRVLVGSSVPLVWNARGTSIVTYWAENDRYSGHPDMVDSTAALLEVVLSSSKVSALIAGDVHVISHSSVCATGEPGLAAEAAASMLAERGVHWTARASAKRCVPQWVSSGVTWMSSTAYRPHITAFFSLLRHALTPRVGRWEAAWHDIWLGNGHVVLTVPVAVPAEQDDAINTQWPIGVSPSAAQQPLDGLSCPLDASVRPGSHTVRAGMELYRCFIPEHQWPAVSRWHGDTFESWRAAHGDTAVGATLPVTVHADGVRVDTTVPSSLTGEARWAGLWHASTRPHPAARANWLQRVIAQASEPWLAPGAPVAARHGYDGGLVLASSEARGWRGRAVLRPLPPLGLARLMHLLHDECWWVFPTVLAGLTLGMVLAAAVVLRVVMRLVAACLRCQGQAPKLKHD